MASGGRDASAPDEKPDLLKFYLADALPAHVRDGARLLDANITKEEHARQLPRDHWYEAVKDRKLCRIPAFRNSYEQAYRVADGGRKSVFRARLHDNCSRNTREVDGSSSRFAVTQVDEAETGALLTFDRAVIIVYSFNEILVEEILRSQRTPEPDEERIAQLKDTLLPWHCVSISCFYFAEMRDAIAAAVNHYGGSRQLIEALSQQTEQPYDVIRDLLAPTELTAAKGPDREVHYCGAYPTLRRIYKALEEVGEVKAKLDRVPRDGHIQRLHVGIGNKKAPQSERLAPPRFITRPPYEWSEPDARGPWPVDLPVSAAK